VHWSFRGPQDLVLIGRAEQVDVAKGISSSYACQNCCGDSFDHGACLPSVIIGLPGDTNQFTAQEYDHSCYGTVGAPFYVSPSSWSTDNTAVATINSSGLATAQGEGSTNIVAQWTSYVRHLTGYPAYCITDTIFPGASAVCTVQVPTFLQVVSDNCAPILCDNLGIPNGFTAQVREIYYIVLDSNRNPIHRAGMTIREVLNITNSGCGGQVPTAATWTTDGTGTMTQPDTIADCSSTCATGGNCTVAWDQFFIVNNSLGVRIISANGQTVGTKNGVSVTCPSCPTVNIIP